MIRRLTFAAGITALMLLLAEVAAVPRLIYVTKPVTTILIGLIAWAAGAGDPRYRHRILVGLMASLAGDIFLMLPGGWFVPGLVCFLAAHLAYIAAFVSGRRALAEWRPLIPFAGFGVGYLALLWSGLGDLRLPVATYVAAIVTMAWQAHARAMEGRRGARLAAIGSVFFVASDALLAWNRFRQPFPWAGPAITLTYVAAQWLIARSVDMTESAVIPIG